MHSSAEVTGAHDGSTWQDRVQCGAGGRGREEWGWVGLFDGEAWVRSWESGLRRAVEVEVLGLSPMHLTPGPVWPAPWHAAG